MATTASHAASGASALPPVHPGVIIRDTVLPAIGKTPAELADLLGVTSAAVSDLLHGAPLTADMALRVGKLCGNGPDLWLGMQAAYDLRIAGDALGGELDRIPTLHEAA